MNRLYFIYFARNYKKYYLRDTYTKRIFVKHLKFKRYLSLLII